MSKYEFKIDLGNAESTHTKTVSLVGRNKRVLDVGCASGYMAESLREHFGCKVTGLELDPEDAKAARRYCEKVIEGNIENLDLKQSFGDEKFDVVVFADVLEHLRDPAAVLRNIKPLVKEAIVISIPNIAHASVMLEILSGNFNYRDLGLLDNTHLRFFTKRTLIDLVESSGYAIEQLIRTTVEPQSTEFQSDLSKFPKPVLEYVQSVKDSKTYQFVVRARPLKPGEVAHYNDVADLEMEIGNLQTQLAHKEEALLWHSKKLREQLAVFHNHEMQLKAIIEDRERILAHSNRLQRYHPDRLPKILSYPLKGIIFVLAELPSRIFRKMSRWGLSFVKKNFRDDLVEILRASRG